MGQTITAERTQTDVPVGVTITRDGGIPGLTIEAKIFRGDDTSEWLDFDDGTFKSSLHVDDTLTVPEVNATEAPGLYAVDGGFDLSAITLNAATRHLLVQYDITAGGETGTDTDTIDLVLDHKRIAFNVWEEILTGAVHNVPTSAGRRLRELSFEIESGLAQAGAAQSITLELAESSVDGFFDERNIGIVAGTGVGQIRTVQQYVGATRVAQVHRPWDVVPDVTSEYILGGSAPTLPTLGLAGKHQVFEVLSRQAASPFKALTGRLRVYDSAANAALDDGATGLLKTYNTVSTYDLLDLGPNLITHTMTLV